MKKKEFNKHVNTGLKIVFGISLSVASAVAIIVLLLILMIG